MNRAERLNAVLDLLAEAGQIDVDDLVAKLDVSAATARRDLDALASQQLLTRTRGGAIASPSPTTCRSGTSASSTRPRSSGLRRRRALW